MSDFPGEHSAPRWPLGRWRAGATDGTPSPAARAGRMTPSRVEIALLCALMFSVPLLEVPKHWLWLAWVVAWLATRGVGALTVPAWRARDAIVVVFAAAVLAAGLFTAHWRASLQGSGDGLRLAITLFLVMRGGYDARRLMAVLASALAGTLLALGWAVAVLLRAGGGAFLELHSVGHVNHTAIYLAIATSVAVGLAVAAWRTDRRLGRLAAVAAFVLGVSLFVAASRAALGATVVALGLFAWIAPMPGATSRVRRRLRVALVAALLGAALVYVGVERWSPQPLQPAGEGLSEKFESRPAEAGVLAFRDRLWRVALLAAGSNPVFGIGNNRFRTLTPQSLCPHGTAAIPAPGAAGAAPQAPQAPDATTAAPAAPAASAVWPDPCDESQLYFAPHAHSLYANTLAERGVFGLLATLALLGLWSWAIVAGLRACRNDDAGAGLWVAALGAWSVTVLAGLLNTTLQHEHGLLAVVLLGGLLAATPTREARTD